MSNEETMDVTFKEIIMLKAPIKMMKSLVCLNDFSLLISLWKISLKIIEEVSRVVAAVDRTAEINAATRIPVAQSGKKALARFTSAELFSTPECIMAAYIPTYESTNPNGISIAATMNTLLKAVFESLAQNTLE
jgi:hypothetical protein